MLFSIPFSIISGRIGAYVGNTRLLTTGTIIYGIANMLFLIPPIHKSYLAIIFVRALGAAGQGLFFAILNPATVALVG